VAAITAGVIGDGPKRRAHDQNSGKSAPSLRKGDRRLEPDFAIRKRNPAQNHKVHPAAVDDLLRKTLERERGSSD